jgi:hypothetical protein
MRNSTNKGSGLRTLCALSVAVLGVFVGQVQQVYGLSSVTYNFDTTLFGTPPSGPTPWLTAVFSDGSPGTVNLTLSAPGLTGIESVDQMYFNLNPALNPSSMTFTQTGSSGAFGAPVVGVGADSFKAPYDGKYDIMLSFSSAAGSQFVHGDSVSFSITGIAGLTANDFLYQNTPSSGHGPLFAAANIQTVGEAVITDTPPGVPDGGATVIFLGLSLLTLEGARRGLRLARR